MARRPQLELVTAGVIALMGCTQPEETTPPANGRPSRPTPVLTTDDEALLASLLSDDPGDFHQLRARIWRLGSARWVAGGPELPGRPGSDELARPLEVVVVDEQGPRVLLPLDELGSLPQWSALRIVAALAPGDLVAGLRHELRPTPWLTLAAGLALTPQKRVGEDLAVAWSDPACGFGLEMVVEAENFGPLYEPGPAGPPYERPGAVDPDAPRLAAGAPIYADAGAREPLMRLDSEPASHGERMSAAQQLTLIGKPSRGRQEIQLRCRGVAIHGFVESRAIVHGSASYAVVDDAPVRASSCDGRGSESITVGRATPLYEPISDGTPALIGVVAQDTELVAKASGDGWWTACVPSPWGDLLFQFQLR